MFDGAQPQRLYSVSRYGTVPHIGTSRRHIAIPDSVAHPIAPVASTRRQLTSPRGTATPTQCGNPTSAEADDDSYTRPSANRPNDM